MEWVKVNNYPNYEVSDQGDVRNAKTGRILKHRIKNGYHQVVLYSCGRAYDLNVSRIVAESYIPNPLNLPEVDHKLGKDDNSVSNLQWITQADNTEKSNAKHWRITTPDGEELEIFNLSKFCKEHGLDRGHMVKVSKGIHKQHKGYKVKGGVLSDQ